MFESKNINNTATAENVIDASGYLNGFPTGADSHPSGTDSVTFIACGDMGPVRNLESIVVNGGSSKILGELKPILKEADFVFANIEAIFSKRGKPLDRTPVFRLDPAAFDLVRQANVKIASLANNHMFDYGPDAFIDTVDLLSHHNIKYFGAGLTYEDAVKPTIIEIQKIKFGFIGFKDREAEIYPDNGVITPKIHPKYILDAVAQLKSKVDWVVVSLHFGLEYKFTPCPDDVRLCREIIDGGANIILGHHPHYPQGVEKYNDGLIAYSLGNFVWDQNFIGHTSSSYCLEISVEKKRLRTVKVIPFYMTRNYRLKLNLNKDAIEKIGKLSLVLIDEKDLDVKWYFITRNLFQLFCKDVWQKIIIDHLSPLVVREWWVQQLGPRYKKTVKDFLKYVYQCKAFKYETFHLLGKLNKRK